MSVNILPARRRSIHGKLVGLYLSVAHSGFGTLTAVGVGSRMVPTFLLAHGDDRRRLHLILGLATTGLVVFPTGALAGFGPATRIGALLLGASVVAILEPGWRWFGRRGRGLDPSLRHVATAFVATAVLAWLLMLVIGVMAKIVSHLSYQHFSRTMPGFAQVGNPNLLLRADWMLASWGLLSVGSLALPVALDQGNGPNASRAFLPAVLHREIFIQLPG